MRLLAFLAALLLGAPAFAQSITAPLGITAITGDCAASGPGSAAIVCTKTNGTNLGTMAVQNVGAVAITGGTITGTTTKLISTTVGALPTCNAGAAGISYLITDALTPVALATVVGGGAVVVRATCNGTAWIVG